MAGGVSREKHPMLRAGRPDGPDKFGRVAVENAAAGPIRGGGGEKRGRASRKMSSATDGARASAFRPAFICVEEDPPRASGRCRAGVYDAHRNEYPTRV